MSSLLKQYKKNVEQNKLEFEPMMYKNFYGSFAIAIYRCISITMDKGDKEKLRHKILKEWRRMKKGKELLPFCDDKEVISKLEKLWDLEFCYGNIALIVSSNNSLFVPCYKTEEGKIQIIPLREDGRLSRTMLEGKAYLVTKETEKGETDMKKEL